jgi:hypothetical protein
MPTHAAPTSAALVAAVVSAWCPDVEVDVGAYQLGASQLAIASTVATSGVVGLVTRTMAASFAMVSGTSAVLNLIAGGRGALPIASTCSGTSVDYVDGTGVRIAAQSTFIGAAQAGNASAGQLAAHTTMTADSEVFTPANTGFYRYLSGIDLVINWGFAGSGNVVFAEEADTTDPADEVVADLHHAMHIEASDPVGFVGKTVAGQDVLDPSGIIIEIGAARLTFSMTPPIVDVSIDLLTGRIEMLPLSIFTGDDDVVVRAHFYLDGNRASTLGSLVRCQVTAVGSAVTFFDPSQETCVPYDDDNGIVDYVFPEAIDAPGQYLAQFSVTTSAGRKQSATPIPFTVDQGL